MASTSCSTPSGQSADTKKFTNAEQDFLNELEQLHGVIDRILPIMNRNPEPAILVDLCKLTAKLIAQTKSTLGTRTFYVFSRLYRETTATDVKPYLAARATEEIVQYIKDNSTLPEEKQAAPIATILKVLRRVMDDPGTPPRFAKLTAAQKLLGLGGDLNFSALFIFSPKQCQIMARWLLADAD